MTMSPLRYPGGKAKLFPFFSRLITDNNLYGITYCEPYAGGAGLAIKLLCNGFVDQIWINDLDASVYFFWRSVFFETDRLCDKIIDTEVSIEEWHRQRSIWINADDNNAFDLGFALYFLNRTNRSGIIEGAGPIGGYAQEGIWKLDARLVKEKQIDNIKQLARFSSQVIISNMDAVKYISEVDYLDNSMLYLDPPYYVKGHKLYKNFYDRRDHEQIAGLMLARRSKYWVVSYDDVPEIREIYNKFNPIMYSLNYSAGRNSSGREVIFMSDRLKVPVVDGFLAVA